MIGVGAAVGNYQVKSQIGEGGMGIVWLAEHPLIGRRVAIKVISPSYARNPEAVSRFLRDYFLSAPLHQDVVLAKILLRLQVFQFQGKNHPILRGQLYIITGPCFCLYF